MSEESDNLAAVIAAQDQSRAGMEDLARHLVAFHSTLSESEDMEKYDALELTRTMLIECMNDDDE